MNVMLQRPSLTKHTKSEMAEYFRILAGSSSPPGKIKFEVLKSAIRNGDGGIDPSLAEEMVTMMANIPGGEVDYIEIINLFMGVSKV